MAEEDDLITIVDVTDPDDPSYADIKTRRRPLTDSELSVLKPMLTKVGAYKFFSMEFNFADGPAVKQFIETVELEEYKRSKQRKQVQESMKGIVAGREVIIDSELIEKTFGLVDDGENIIKPKGETNGLHAFYIKPKYVHLCQNYRGVYLKLFKSEYSYFVNLTHQIQTYCCGGPAERQITLTHYRAIDLMIRGQPVNWNRYLLQNIQDKLRKYKQGPCSLHFGGTLTALIYKALHVDYSLVNKPLMISPQTPERLTLSDGDAGSGKKKALQLSKHKDIVKVKEVVPPKKRDVSRHAGMVTRAQRTLATESPALESVETEVGPPITKRSSAAVKALDRKRKRVKERVQIAVKKQKDAKKKRTEEIDSDPSVMENEDSEEETEDDEEEHASTKGGKFKKRICNLEIQGDEIVLSTRTDRISSLLSQATGSPIEGTVALTPSKNLWSRYDRIYSLQHEYQLEHIVSKQMLEQSLQRVQELEELLKEKDIKLAETEREVNRLRSGKQGQLTLNGEEQLNVNGDEQGPLKIRLKVKGYGDEKDNGEDKGEEEEDKGVNSDEDRTLI